MILAKQGFVPFLFAAAFVCALALPLNVQASDGAPPNPPAITVNGASLPPIAPFAETQVATSSTVWDVVLTFEEDILNLPSVTDGTPAFGFSNGTVQTVNDCADADLKTFCLTYAPPMGIEAAVFWFFKVSGAEDLSGEPMGDATYRFVVDTGGPLLSFTQVESGDSLPTISGESSFGSALVALTLAGPATRTYETQASGGIWSYTLQAGDELPAGTYIVTAAGRDQYGNVGATIESSLIAPEPPPPLDTVPPVLTETTAIGSTSDTTPSYAFSSSEAGSILYGGSCSSADIVAAAGMNTITFFELPLGTYSDCTITVTDAAGNPSTPLAVSVFSIVPPAPTTGALLVTVTSAGADGTFSFTGDLGAFTVTTSGGFGTMTFEDIPAGVYQVIPSAASGWSIGPNSCAEVTIVAGEGAECSVSYSKSTTTGTKGYIVGLLFHDKDGDARLDKKGEVTLLGSTGWKAYLDLDNDGARDSGEPYTTTSLFGLYLFKNVNPGTYTVRIEPKAGKTLTKPSSGFHTATVVAKHAAFGGLFGWH